jgi:hypothetical protein
VALNGETGLGDEDEDDGEGSESFFEDEGFDDLEDETGLEDLEDYERDAVQFFEQCERWEQEESEGEYGR